MALRKLGEDFYEADTLQDVLNHVVKQRREQARLDREAHKTQQANNAMFTVEVPQSNTEGN